MRFSYSTPREISKGLKRKWDYKMGGTISSAKIIEDVDKALKALGIFFSKNGTAVERLVDKNGHIRRKVCEVNFFSWGGARTKVEGCKCKLKIIIISTVIYGSYVRRKN